MKSGSSAFISSGGQSAEAEPTASWYQTSRPSLQPTSPPVRLTTSTWRTPGQDSKALSVLAFKGIFRPPRRPSSAVMTNSDSQSWMRPAKASGEKPPKTTEWIAPMRAQASMA